MTWEVSLDGYGQSSPVKYGDLIYVTFVSGENKENLHVWAISFESGEVVWKREAKNSTPEENNSYVSRAAPSPVCDRNGVVAFFEGGNVVAYSPSGELRWERDLVEDYGEIKARNGLASSLEHTKDRVFAWVERGKDPYVVCLSKATGESIWKSEGVGVTTWSTPRLVPVGDGKSHLVLSGIGKLAGLDPETGKRLWAFDEIANNSTPTPIPLGNGLFLLGSTDGRGGGRGGKAAAYNGVFEIAESNGRFAAEYVWKAKQATSSFGSPIVHKGLAYFVNRAGVLYCLDVETGDERYAKRSAESLWATPIAFGDRMLLPGKEGTMTLVDVSDHFEEVGRRNVFESSRKKDVLYAAILVGKSLVVRCGNCVRRY